MLRDDFQPNAQEALALVQHTSRDELDTNRMLNLALVRLLEIIGEAARCVLQKTQEHCPDISWFQIISLRNRLIHGYDVIDFDILWEILTKDLPPLVTQLDAILARDRIEE